MSIPVVKKDEKGIPTLYVNDQPFFCYSGEVHNSSASDPAYMEREVWPRLQDLNMNSVIVPIYWELIEEEEGSYQFETVDELMRQAKENGKKLILLWFGLWKNAESMYVPGWMKQDTERFFRVEKVNGEKINTVSPLCDAAIEKDTAAFTAVMKHIRELDEKDATVIMMQVENEIGLLGTDCDYSEQAREAFGCEIPEILQRKYEVSGTWKEAFGENAEEYFMAYHFAKAVETITSAGREEYPLPCYANAWLKQYPWYPGSYPSGGPVVEVHKIWKAAAPSLFTLAPDIYVPYCADVFDEYAYEGNPLVVPEVRKDAVAASYCLYAFAAKNAICFSPFGIEELALDPSQIDKPPMEVMIALNIDPSAFDTTGSKEYLAATYKLMKDLEPLLLKYRGTDHLKAFVRHGEYDYGCFQRFSNYNIKISYSPRMTAKPLGAGLIMELSENRFLLVGMECAIEFQPKNGENVKVDIIRMEEGCFEGGEWKSGRVLNGDEKMMLRFGDMPKCCMVEVYKY